MTNVVVSPSPTISVSVSTISPGGDTVECGLIENPIVVNVSSIGIQGPSGGTTVRKKLEYLVGVIDGVNKDFSTTENFIEGSAVISINGLEQTPDSYTSFPQGKLISFSEAPSNNVFEDVLIIHYLY